jgi:putative nucleotidyltransferase with HDIG domain
MSLPARAEHDGPSGRPRLRRILERVENVPALPEVVTRILTLLDDPSASAHRLAEVIGQDQSMVSTILKLVNSPFYGLSGRVVSIQHAVVLLGFRAIRNVALSSVLMKVFGDSERDSRFNRRDLWRHTVSCAIGARMMAGKLRCADPEEAFLAGLLHDMGLVILDQYFHAEFRRVLDLVESGDCTIRQAERNVFGHDHAAVGALLARKWNFPEPVCDAIACHHHPSRARRAAALAALVHLSTYLPPVGAEERTPPVWDTEPCEIAAFAIARIGPEEFPAFRAAFSKEWDKAQAFLNSF